MFRDLINDAKTASGSLIDKNFARAAVAVPFVVALGFATAAVTLMLINRFGYIAAFWMIAGGSTLIGLTATRVVTAPRYRSLHLTRWHALHLPLFYCSIDKEH